MTTLALERPDSSSHPGPTGAAADGGLPARRAVVRFAWRMFRREWRQQLMVLALITVAVAATIVGAAVAVNTPPAASAGFGTAQDLASFQSGGPRTTAAITSLHHKFGAVDVIANQQMTIPGSVSTFDLRAQDPHGPYGGPMLGLVQGRDPADVGEVALTPALASTFGVHLGSVWRVDGVARTVVGLVQNPQSLLDQFTLVVPGQVADPTQVTVLFDAHGIAASAIGPNVESEARVAASNANALNPETIVLALVTIGMLLIGLVSVGGFTVIAQRRLRSMGLLGSIGAADRHLRLVVRANGAVVGVVGALAGAVIGLGAWFAYRPRLEQSAHHLIGALALPWVVIGPAMGLAVVTSYLAATRPARAMTRLPIVAALSGRPAPPRQIHRTALPGVVVMVVAFFLIGAAGASNGGSAMPLVLGLVAMVVGVILLAPMCLTLLARLTRRMPIAVRLVTRDLARQRARSGSALAAISVGVLIAVIICVVAGSRYSDQLDYAGPNLASNQLLVWAPVGPGGSPDQNPPPPSAGQLRQAAAGAQTIAASVGGTSVELDTPSANLNHAAAGRQWNGALYVATPQLLRALGIPAGAIDPNALVLTMRPGISTLSLMQLQYSNASNTPSQKGGGGQQQGSGPGTIGPGSTGQQQWPCPANACVANPRIQYVGALPSGVSAPNTLITETAMQRYHLQSQLSGWFVQSNHTINAAQITQARVAAASAGVSVESKNDEPTSSEVIDWATIFGIVLALGILAMTVGLIRSESGSELRTLTATGAGPVTRRNLTAVTAGALALLGAVLGTLGGYLTSIGYARTSHLDGLHSLEASIPVVNLLLILVGMPLVAMGAAWLLAGREPPVVSRQPME